MNSDAEKQLWASIQSKGILHKEVQSLYLEARSAYENIILNDHDKINLQDVEYCLWKLHYKHIDEFRKRMRSTSGNEESAKSETRRQGPSNVVNNINIHLEGFKLFVSEATEFYKNLIRKFQSFCGLPDEVLTHKKDGPSFSGKVEPVILQRCNYVIHRFLVCLGDLARYRELCKKPDGENRKWIVAATYYLEATMVWPDSGNPQNQLALLATYVGDDFLALYHCIRSLAVNDPFPDAWDNLMLLFEKSRSSRLHSLSRTAQFDWLNPSKRCCLSTKAHTSIDSMYSKGKKANEHVSNTKTDLWPLFVRMISFFLTKSSLEEFPWTFASTMTELDSLLELDDTKLESFLEPYEQLDPSRKGPYRGLQFASILIFGIHNLFNRSEVNIAKGENATHLSALMQLAWACMFTFLGRFLERCLKGNSSEDCSLLPSVLVSVEWLVGNLGKSVVYARDEKVSTARSYFIHAFVDFLNRLHSKEGKVNSPGDTALWEDYELRGFGPISHSHESLNFSNNSAHICKYESGNKIRARRILYAAMKISETVDGTQSWIFYDHSARKFIPSRARNEIEGDNLVGNSVKGESCGVEEEEVILFKPIVRHNLAPISDLTSTEPSDDLRRASSLLVGQDEAQLNDLNLRFKKPFKKQEPGIKDIDMSPTGPPSLSAWVLDKDRDKDKGRRSFNKHELLPPIEELTNSLSVREEAVDFSYVAPVPSAPLLPEDASWYGANSLGSNDGHGILGAPQLVNKFSNFPAIPGFIDGYKPVIGMSSSEWLYHYKNNHVRPAGKYSNAPAGYHGVYNGHEGSRFDRLGNPLGSAQSLVNGVDEQRRERLVLGYQRTSPSGCGVGTTDNLRTEQKQLLQVLKEREWQLQRESSLTLRGPTYMDK